MKKKHITVTITEYNSRKELTQNENELVDACIKAADTAWAPYSGFKVGAAVLLGNGEIVTGSNQENAAYPSGLCAERVALFSAHTQFPDQPVIALAVSSKKAGELSKTPVAPCGNCRQVIIESNKRFNRQMKIIMTGSEKIQILSDSNLLLPLDFNSNFLT